MPKGRKPGKAALTRLSRLPHDSDMVIEGGRRRLGIFIRENRQTIQPDITLWVDAQSRWILGSDVIDPTKGAERTAGEALDSLVKALTKPMPVPLGGPPPRAKGAKGKDAESRLPTWSPALPGKLLVNDAALAEAARAILEPLGTTVEQKENLPAFEEAFAAMSEALGADLAGGPPPVFAWELDPALLADLYAAATEFAQGEPWDYMPDSPPLAISLAENGPAPGVDTLYASVMGAGGQVFGAALYYSLEDYRQAVHQGIQLQDTDEEEIDAAIELLRRAGAPIDQVPEDELRDVVADAIVSSDPDRAAEEMIQNSLALIFESSDESDPTYLEWLEDRGIVVWEDMVPTFMRTAPGTDIRQPDEREARALTLSLQTLNRFFKKYRRVLGGPMLPPDGLTLQVPGAGGQPAVEVRFPPPGYDWVADLVDAEE